MKRQYLVVPELVKRARAAFEEECERQRAAEEQNRQERIAFLKCRLDEWFGLNLNLQSDHIIIDGVEITVSSGVERDVMARHANSDEGWAVIYGPDRLGALFEPPLYPPAEE